MVLNHHSTRLCARVGGTVVKQMPGCPWPGDPEAPVREREKKNEGERGAGELWEGSSERPAGPGHGD